MDILREMLQAMRERVNPQSIDLSSVYSGLNMPEVMVDSIREAYFEATIKKIPRSSPLAGPSGLLAQILADPDIAKKLSAEGFDRAMAMLMILEEESMDKDAKVEIREKVAQAAAKFFRDTGLPVEDTSEIAAGGESSLYLFDAALKSLKKKKRFANKVIIPEPYFEATKGIAEDIGLEVISIPTHDTGYKLDPARLQEVLDRQDAEDILCMCFTNPTNPTFQVYSEEELEKLGSIILKNDLSVISDELYSHMEMDGKKHTSIGGLRIADEEGHEHSLYPQVITINGTSKKFELHEPTAGFCCSGDAELIAGIQNKVNKCVELDVMDSIAVSTVMEKMPPEVLLECAKQIQKLRDRYLEHVANVEKKGIFSSHVHPEATFFSCLQCEPEVAGRYGIHSSSDLKRYLQDIIDVETRSLDGMAMNGPVVRLNFMEGDDVGLAMQRLESLSQKMGKGTAPKLTGPEKSRGY